MSGIKKRASKGVVWSLTENVGMLGISFLAFLVLARLLDKESFGLVALAMAYILFLELFIRAGIIEVVIQRHLLSESDKNTAFWVAAVLGAMALLMSFLLAPFASSWSGHDELTRIIHWLSLGIIPLALSSVQQGLMVREMRFKGLALRRILSSVSGAIVGVACALNGLGVWSLVAQLLTNRVVEFLALYWVMRWLPRLDFSWLSLKNMSDYGWKVIGTNVAFFAGSQIDRILIGHFLGVATLGIYVIGQKLIEILYMVINGVIARVALTAFSRMQTESERLKGACLSVAQLTIVTALPLFVFLAISSVDVIQVVFGEKWKDSAVVAQVLAIAAIVRISFVYLIPALKAQGMAGRVMIALVLQAATSICLAILLSPYGLGMMAIGWSLGHAVSAALLVFYVSNTVSIRPIELIRIYGLPLLAALAAVALVVVADRLMAGTELSIYLILGIKSGVFGIAYLASLVIIAPQVVKAGYAELSGMLLRK